jgi:Rieske Fe-S protein
MTKRKSTTNLEQQDVELVLETDVSKREFLKTSGLLLAGLTVAGGLIADGAQAQPGSGNPPPPDGPGGPGGPPPGGGFGGPRGRENDPFKAFGKGTINLGAVNKFKVNSVTDHSKDAGVIISRTSDGLIALSGFCTHEGCSVSWQSDAKVFQCPCHRAEFLNNGDVSRPPAREPLPHYPLSVKNGHLLVNTNKIVRRLTVTKTDFLKVK